VSITSAVERSWKAHWEDIEEEMMERWKGRARIAPMLTDMLLSSELAREKMWSRIHLIPVLQAEEDRDLVRRHWAEQAREKELLGAETKVYNNDRYVRKLLEIRL
jgi:hypothetical protein